jgi:uncharacterized repeat protein (TIGR03806 family)
MKKLYLMRLFACFTLFITISSCQSDDPVDYAEIPTSPVSLDFNATPFPYEKLSEYNFFEGEMKNMEPVYKVIPYDLNSALFTDYAHKKRFIWMPDGVNATYNADNEILDFPSGTVLIKNFYYNNVQPGNVTRIIETRLMIKKNNTWLFANYVWNDAQTEATLNMNGSYTDISWNENGEVKNTSYRIPSGAECFTCHKNEGVAMPIGPKPQNLNKAFTYGGNSLNQLQKLVNEGYLDYVPSNIASSVNWADESKPTEERVRSYLDINCAHCHREGSHCDYRPMRLAFNETTNPVNMGICVPPQEVFTGDQNYIIAKGSAQRSVMHYRLSSVNESERMPLLGRTVVHTEGVKLIKEWINAMDTTCP